jgi:hypothetical protein
MKGGEHSQSRLLDTRRPRGRLMASLTPVQRTERPIPARRRLPKFPYQFPRERSVEASNVRLSHQRLQAAEHRRAPTPSLKRRRSIRDTSERPRRLASVANAPRGVVPAMRTLRPERASTALVWRRPRPRTCRDRPYRVLLTWHKDHFSCGTPSSSLALQ